MIGLLLNLLILMQIPLGSSGKSPVNGYTFVQATSGTGLCITPCTFTVNSTGTGHLLYLQGTIFSTSSFITSVSGACSGGGWVIPVASQISVIGDGSLSSAYCLSSTSGATSISITTTNNARVRFWEYSASNPPAFDVCGTVNNSVAATLQPGVALTLATSQEVIIQTSLGTANITAISSPYGNFLNFGGVQLGSGDNQNTSSGTAPNWTMVSGNLIGNACAFK
jgi:hypothetical protein